MNTRAMRRAGAIAGLLTTALLPLAAAVAAQPASSQMPMAITQQPAMMTGGTPGSLDDSNLPECGLLLLVGSALMGLAAVVRRTTRT